MSSEQNTVTRMPQQTAEPIKAEDHVWPPAPNRKPDRCPVCGGRGWHTAGGNDPAPCGACGADEGGAVVSAERLPLLPGRVVTDNCPDAYTRPQRARLKVDCKAQPGNYYEADGWARLDGAFVHFWSDECERWWSYPARDVESIEWLDSDQEIPF